jgi:hypothetical protein
MSIVLQGSTSGSVTLQEPAVAGTTVLDLPAVSGTVITTGTTGQVIASGALPIGSVLQIINATYSIQTSSITNTSVSTGLTASITPKFATSKILVIVSQAGCSKDNSNTYINLFIYRNASSIFQFESEGGYTNSSATNSFGACSANYLDSPATTSALTYTTYFRSAANSSVVKVQASNSGSTITLMEIAG